MVMEMQRTCKEQQSNVDNVIRQVALLTMIMKEMQGNGTKSGVREEVKEKGITAAEGKSEVQLEEAGTGEMESNMEKMQTADDELHKVPKKDEKVTKQEGRLTHTLSYLPSEKVQVPNKKVVEFTTAEVKEKEMPEGKPFRVTNLTGDYCDTKGSEPEQKWDWSRNKDAKDDYWAPLDTWPGLLKKRNPTVPDYAPRKTGRSWELTRTIRKDETP